MRSTPLIFSLIKYEELNGLCRRVVNFYFKEGFRVSLKQQKKLVKRICKSIFKDVKSVYQHSDKTFF